MAPHSHHPSPLKLLNPIKSLSIVEPSLLSLSDVQNPSCFTIAASSSNLSTGAIPRLCQTNSSPLSGFLSSCHDQAPETASQIIPNIRQDVRPLDRAHGSQWQEIHTANRSLHQQQMGEEQQRSEAHVHQPNVCCPSLPNSADC